MPPAAPPAATTDAPVGMNGTAPHHDSAPVRTANEDVHAAALLLAFAGNAAGNLNTTRTQGACVDGDRSSRPYCTQRHCNLAKYLKLMLNFIQEDVTAILNAMNDEQNIIYCQLPPPAQPQPLLLRDDITCLTPSPSTYYPLYLAYARPTPDPPNQISRAC